MRAAALLLAVVACSPGARESRALTPPSGEVWLEPRQAEALRLEVVEARPIHDTVLVGGKIAFDDLKVSHVFSPLAGRIVRVLAAPGQRVRKGDPLATILSPDMGAAASDLAKAQADLDAASRDFQRQKELYQAHAGSQKDFETAEDSYRKAQAEFQRARAKARPLWKDQSGPVTEEYALRAPIDGEVIFRTANPGVDVQGQYSGGNTTELFTIGELDQVYLLADVHEMDLSSVQKGESIRARVLSYPERVFPGTIDWVAAALDPTTHTARVRCILDNSERLLKPEMYATVELRSDRGKQLSVARSALVHLGSQALVFVSRGPAPDGRARFERRPVNVDEDISGDYLPVTRGLSAGDIVVVEGALLLNQVS
jgi:membrane fusion protein, heavy metal efflux system